MENLFLDSRPVLIVNILNKSVTYKFFIQILDLSETILPPHLLGLNGLIGVIASFLEFRDNIGPCIDRLYAVLPAGVETSTPSVSYTHLTLPPKA